MRQNDYKRCRATTCADDPRRRPRRARALPRAVLHSLRTLSAHSISRTRIVGLANDAFFPCRSAPRTPEPSSTRLRRGSVCRARSWRGASPRSAAIRPDDGGGHRMRHQRDAPRRAGRSGGVAGLRQRVRCRNGNAAFVGSSEPHALLTRTFMLALFVMPQPSASPARLSDCHGLTEVRGVVAEGRAGDLIVPAPAEPTDEACGCPDTERAAAAARLMSSSATGSSQARPQRLDDLSRPDSNPDR